jgi:hypothetical protein
MKPHAERKHARFAPSSAHRWVNCPGSVSLAEQFPNKSSPAADEGTAAHEIAERCLNKGWDVADHYTTDNAVEVRPGVLVPVTEDMIEGVQLYLDYVRGIFDQCDEFAIEARLDMSHIHPEFFGTGDAIGYDAATETLHVMDFKFGRKAVDPFENWQAIAYAIGAARKYHNRPVTAVVVHIVQPRVSSVPAKWFMGDTLTAYETDLRKAVKSAGMPSPMFHAGDWCEYCPAAAVCPTLKDRAIAVARDEFGNLKKDRSTIALADALSEIDILESWCKQVRATALDMATAGATIPGFKLVQRRAVRKWTSPENVEAHLVGSFSLAKDEIYERKLRSPAQIEKLLGKYDRTVMADLITKVSSGITLAPDSDKRPAISPDAAQEFSKVEIEDV